MTDNDTHAKARFRAQAGRVLRKLFWMILVLWGITIISFIVMFVCLVPLLNVLFGERYGTFTKESKSLLSGEYGELPGTVNEAVRKKAIGESESITCRPADLLEPELARIKQQYSDIAKTEEDVLTCAMFPQVAPEFIRRRDDLVVHEIEVEWV